VLNVVRRPEPLGGRIVALLNRVSKASRTRTLFCSGVVLVMSGHGFLNELGGRLAIVASSERPRSRVGWFKEVQVKSLGAHERMALLGVRRGLVDIPGEIDGQIRGILKTFGLVVRSGNKGAFAQRARMMTQDHPILSALFEKLLDVEGCVSLEAKRPFLVDGQQARLLRALPTRKFIYCINRHQNAKRGPLSEAMACLMRGSLCSVSPEANAIQSKSPC
jgi:hypothetical protein